MTTYRHAYDHNDVVEVDQGLTRDETINIMVAAGWTIGEAIAATAAPGEAE